MQLTAQIHDKVEDLGFVWDEWDELAVALGRPFAAPAWASSWWTHLGPPDSRLHLIVVRRASRLVGVAPLFFSRWSCRSLGGGLAPVEILASPGQEAEVAATITADLARSSPPSRTLELDLHDSSPDWAALLRDAWPGSDVWRWTKYEDPAPTVDFSDGFESWMNSRSKSFRREMRQKRRRLDDGGGSFRLADRDTLGRDVRGFLRLHRLRLAGRGGTRLGVDGIEQMLLAVGKELIDAGRFRLQCLELGGELIAAQLLLAAGSEVSAWSIGFDEAYAKLSPAMLCMVHSLRYAAERGEATMSLGAGGQDYKYRLANADDRIRSELLVPRGAAYLATRLRLVPQRARHGLSKRLSSKTRGSVRRLVRR